MYEMRAERLVECASATMHETMVGFIVETISSTSRFVGVKEVQRIFGSNTGPALTKDEDESYLKRRKYCNMR